jgi:hypothetical protein
MAKLIVTRFGLTTEASINDQLVTQCAANFTRGDVQQSTTIKVIFFVSIKESVELITLIPFLTSFKVQQPKNK